MDLKHINLYQNYLAIQTVCAISSFELTYQINLPRQIPLTAVMGYIWYVKQNCQFLICENIESALYYRIFLH